MNNSKRSILLVEDNDDDSFLLCRAFQSAGVKEPIEVVTDGKQAMDYLCRCQSNGPLPLLVLLDLQLPFFTGFELLQWIRQQNSLRRLPVVMLTSSTQPSDIQRAYELHANSYLVKPTDVGCLSQLAKGIKLYWMELNQEAPPPEVRSLTGGVEHS